MVYTQNMNNEESCSHMDAKTGIFKNRLMQQSLFTVTSTVPRNSYVTENLQSPYCADSIHAYLFLSTHFSRYTFIVLCRFHQHIPVSINTLFAVYLQSTVQIPSTHTCFYQHTFRGIPSELCAGFIHAYLFLSTHFPRYTFRVICRFHPRIPVSINTLFAVYLQSTVQIPSTHTCFYQQTFRGIPSELCAGFIHAYLFLSTHFPRYTFRVMCGFHPRIPVSINTLFAVYLQSYVQVSSTHTCFSQYTFRAIPSELCAGFIHAYLFLSTHFSRYTFRLMCRFHQRIHVSLNTLSVVYLQSYVRVSSTHTCFYQHTFRGIPSELCAGFIHAYLFLSTHFSRYTFRVMCGFHPRIPVSLNTLSVVYLQS